MERSVEASTGIRAPVARAKEVLREDPAQLFTDRLCHEDRRLRRVPTEVVTELGAGAAVAQEVVVELGSLVASDAELVLPLTWQPAGHERLLPDFGGELVVGVDDVGNTRLVLRGLYQVPLGPVGHFGDTLVGRRVARRSLSGFVERIARRLDAEVDRRSAAVPHRPAPYPVDLRESPGSENHLG